MPLIAAVTPHQAEGSWARRGGERVCPPRLALREQGPTLFFPSQRVFLAKVGRLVASRGAAGVASPLGPRAHPCCFRSSAAAGALPLLRGWFWVRLEDEAQGCAWCRGREAGNRARNSK